MTKRSRQDAGIDDDPLASDGSDYDSIESDDDEESDDEDWSFYEPEEFFEGPEATEYLEFPSCPPHATISTQDLLLLIDQHKQEGNLRDFLTSVELENERMVSYKYEIPKEIGAEPPRILYKASNSILHCACLDPNAQRRDEKIRVILSAAARARVDAAELLVTSQEIEHNDDYDDDGDQNEGPYMPPLRLLLDNHADPTSSFQILCQAWPGVVHVKDKLERCGTILMKLMEMNDCNEGIVANVDREPTDEEWVALQEERMRLERRNRGYVLEICQWILSVDESAAGVVDSNGMNPFHFAISKGKKWEDGLDGLAKLVPWWPLSREETTGLYPFAMAATPECARVGDDDSVDTIYELLRFDVSILNGMTNPTADTEHDARE